MASTPKTAVPGNRLFLLALGLLVGFVIGFVMLLSRLPVDTSMSDFSSSDLLSDTGNGSSFQFYSELLGQTVAQKTPEARPAAAVPTQQIIVPATRVVPANVQNLNSRHLASEGYAEIPASSLGQESYYVQAGNFRNAEDAERARAAVLLLGLDAFIVVRRDSTGATGHRVRIGPFFDQPKISEAQQRLTRGGFQTKLIRVTG